MTPLLVPGDSLYADQWHFDLMGNGDGRGAIETIWNEFDGSGINVGVYDSGVQSIHYDLNDNYNAALHVVVGGSTLPGDPIASPPPEDFHGTAVAGIIGAELNGTGVVGIAWDSNLTGVNIFDPSSPAYINAVDFSGFLEAVHQMANFDVTNNSWGAFPGFFVDNGLVEPTGFGFQVNAEFEYAVENGRGGLGTNIVKSAGNENLDSNGDGLNASRYTITVNALLDNGFAANYSNFGANTLVSAPGGDSGNPPVDGTPRITTTDLLGTEGFNTFADPTGPQDFTDRMNGTSAAAPMVSGVIALMLDANPDLGWRDVQEILGLTAFHTGSDIGSGPGLNENHTWYFNGAENWNGGGMHYSEDYGYGNVDPFGAVRMAEAYAIIDAAPKTSANEVQNTTDTLVVDLTPVDGAPGSPVTFEYTFDPDMVIEHVELTIDYTYEFMSDLGIVLTSPDGTDVQVQTPNFDTEASLVGESWVYGIEALHGEASAGTWTLSFADFYGGGSGTINSVQMTVYGTTPVSDDVYHFTDEFAAMLALDASRATLSDTNGGAEWIDMAAISTGVTLNLTAGVASSNGLVIAAGSVIENAITGDGNDTINGNSAANALYGMRGSDTLNGQGGADAMNGGTGNDTYVVNNAGDTASEAGGGGSSDLVQSSVTFTLGVGLEHLTLTGSNNINGTGNGTANILRGNSGNNQLSGAGGADTMIGGLGNDTYVANNAGDTASEAGGGGSADVVISSVSFTLATGLEYLTLTGTANTSGTGSGGTNTLNGNSGANRLDGAGGADTMNGGLGNDTYVVNNGGDTVSESGGGGSADTVESSVSFTLGAGLENLTLTGAAGINATGNGVANILRGNSGANRLDGNGGSDTFVGNGGADTFVFDDGDGADTVNDFQNGSDKCDLTAVAGVDEFSDLVLTDTGGGVDVDYGTGSFELANVANFNDVGASDFVFA